MSAQNQLIPVFRGILNNHEVLLCDARNLHEFLEVGRHFRTWINDRIEEYEFKENQDFVLVAQNGAIKNTQGGDRRSKNYHLTMDMAKELAMVERNEKGREVRRYFIECERKLYGQKVNRAPKLVSHYMFDSAMCNRALDLSKLYNAELIKQMQNTTFHSAEEVKQWLPRPSGYQLDAVAFPNYALHPKKYTGFNFLSWYYTFENNTSPLQLLLRQLKAQGYDCTAVYKEIDLVMQLLRNYHQTFETIKYNLDHCDDVQITDNKGLIHAK